MLDDNEFIQMAAKNIDEILFKARNAYLSIDDDRLCSTIENLFTPDYDGISDYPAYIETLDRNTLRSNVEKSKTFMELYEYMRGDSILTLKGYLESHGYTIKNFQGTDLEVYLLSFYYTFNERWYWNPTWDRYADYYAIPSNQASMLFGELFAEDTVPEQCSAPESFFYDYDTIDEIVDLYAGSSDAPSYDFVQSTAASMHEGKTGTAHLIAEDYGFAKDKLMLALIGAYGFHRGYGHSEKNDAKHIISKWISNKYNFTEFDFLLPMLKFSKKDIKENSFKIAIPEYYRLELIRVLAKLEAGCWYGAEDLWECYRSSTAKLRFEDMEYPWFAATIRAKGIKDGTKEYTLDEIKGNDNLELFKRTDELFRRPIFFGMLYILALFGCLAISEKEPEKPLIKTARKYAPYSPFDGLSAVSITEYGQWVLGYTEKKPEIVQEFSEPVADKDLLLITYKGKSVKVKSLLNEIGEPIGETRFKVTLSSFTSNCFSLNESEDRIKAFMEIITPDPPDNWKRFFQTVRDSYVFMDRESTGTLLSIRNMKAFRDMLDNTELGTLLIKAENGFVYLPDENRPRFEALARKLGYNRPIRSKSERTQEEKKK